MKSTTQTHCILTLLITLAGCSTLPTDQTSALVGVWTLQDFGDPSERYSFTHLALGEDGRRCTLTFEALEDRTETNAYISTWTIEDGAIVTTYGPNTADFEEGFVLRDRIDAFEDETLELFMIEPQGRRVERHRRLPNVSVDRVCQVAADIIEVYERRRGFNW